jgi:hypothetical protein
MCTRTGSSVTSRWRSHRSFGSDLSLDAAPVMGLASRESMDEPLCGIPAIDLYCEVGCSLPFGCCLPIAERSSSRRNGCWLIHERNQLAGPLRIRIEFASLVIARVRVEHGTIHEHTAGQHERRDERRDPCSGEHAKPREGNQVGKIIGVPRKSKESASIEMALVLRLLLPYVPGVLLMSYPKSADPYDSDTLC